MKSFRSRIHFGGPLWSSLLLALFSATTARANLPFPIFQEDVGDTVPGVRVTLVSGANYVRSKGVGDVNGDGVADLLFTEEGSVPADRAFLVYGKQGGVGVSGALDLSSLSEDDGVELVGFAGLNRSGEGAGDVNGDGLNDFVLGLPKADPLGRVDAGTVCVVFGRQGGIGAGGTLDISALNGTDGIRILGAAADDIIGSAVSGVGDFNRDGYGDVGIAGFYEDYATGSHGGRGYVLFGSPTGFGAEGVFDLATMTGSDGVILQDGLPANSEVAAIFGLGDVDGDGISDIGVEISGWTKSLVIFGTTTPPSLMDLLTLSPPEGIEFADTALARGPGDMNGDGWADLVFLDPWDDNIGCASTLYYPGYCYFKLGGPEIRELPSPTTLGPASSGLFQVLQRVSRDLGWNLAALGDVNGDGLGDMIVPCSGTASAGHRFYTIVYGSRESAHPSGLVFDTAFTGERGTRLTLEESSYGNPSSAGDVNGDGLSDFLMEAEWGVGTTNPESYLIYGATSLAQATYCRRLAASNIALAPVGRLSDGSAPLPASRCWVGFDAGYGDGPSSSSLVSATITRHADDVALGPRESLAPVQWNVTTDRVAWTTATLTFQYLDSEIAGLDESLLTVYAAADPAGPYTALAATRDMTRSRVQVSTTDLGYFALGEPGLAVQSPPATPTPTPEPTPTPHAALPSGLAWNAIGDQIPGVVIRGGFSNLGFNSGDDSITGAGDVNGDGVDDLLIGQYQNLTSCDFFDGTAFAVFGGESFGYPIALSGLDGTNGFQIDDTESYGVGVAVAAGD